MDFPDFQNNEENKGFCSFSLLVSNLNNNTFDDNSKIEFNEKYYKYPNLKYSIEEINANNVSSESCRPIPCETNNKFENISFDDFINLSENEDLSLTKEQFIEENELKKTLKIIINNKEEEIPKIKKIFQITKKKRRRHKNNCKDRENNTNFTRGFDEDNINTKIKTNFTNFNTIIVNSVLRAKLKQIGKEKYFKDLKFYPIAHKKKIKTPKNSKKNFQKQTIGDLIKFDVSPKFRSKNPKTNANNYEMIKKDNNLKVISEIFDKNFLFFFDKIYLKRKRTIFNLNEFGFEDLEIKLPKEIKFYQDLLEKNKEKKLFQTYKTRMDICCLKYFTIRRDGGTTIFKARKMKNKK